MLGSGLGSFVAEVAGATTIPFEEIPGHPAATVPGHHGCVVLGSVGDLPTVLWHGRVHFYEGHSMAEVALPVRLMAALGVEAVILTNAAGGLNPDFEPGDLMLVVDHINLPGLAGHHPLRGPQGPAERFVDLSEAYDPALRALAVRVAATQGLALREGVYAMVAGPSYETPAEARLLRMLGADAVGMSTVPEVIVARQLGLRVLALSAITNVLGRAVSGPTHAEVLATAERLQPRFTALLRGVLTRLPEVLDR